MGEWMKGADSRTYVHETGFGRRDVHPSICLSVLPDCNEYDHIQTTCRQVTGIVVPFIGGTPNETPAIWREDRAIYWQKKYDFPAQLKLKIEISI